MRRVGLAVVLIVGLGAVPSWADPPATCSVADTTTTVTPLPHVAAFLHAGETLNVLAIGSANLFRPELSFAPGSIMTQAVQGAKSTSVPPPQVLNEAASGNAFPQQMANALEKMIPGLTVKVTTRGGRGLSASDQLTLLTETVDRAKFQLVLWQTGTVEAVRNLPPSEFAQTLADGAEKATQAGADVVLVDPQFSRFLQTNSDIQPYELAFQTVSAMPSVALFHRFDLMRAWVNDGSIDLEHTPKAQRQSAVEQLHECLGRELARLVISGAKSP